MTNWIFNSFHFCGLVTTNMIQKSHWSPFHILPSYWLKSSPRLSLFALLSPLWQESAWKITFQHLHSKFYYGPLFLVKFGILHHAQHWGSFSWLWFLNTLHDLHIDTFTLIFEYYDDYSKIFIKFSYLEYFIFIIHICCNTLDQQYFDLKQGIELFLQESWNNCK